MVDVNGVARAMFNYQSHPAVIINGRKINSYDRFCMNNLTFTIKH